jgi:hypothetical protein
VALITQAMAKRIAATMASMPICFPSPPTIIGASDSRPGRALVGGGIYLAYSAWKEKFRKDMELGQISSRARRIVEWLGKFGGMARGAVFITAGIFLVVAAVQAKPQQAKGVDSSLRVLASTPLGPWLLVLVAIGLIMFGLFSFCQAKWRRL